MSSPQPAPFWLIIYEPRLAYTDQPIGARLSSGSTNHVPSFQMRHYVAIWPQQVVRFERLFRHFPTMSSDSVSVERTDRSVILRTVYGCRSAWLYSCRRAVIGALRQRWLAASRRALLYSPVDFFASSPRRLRITRPRESFCRMAVRRRIAVVVVVVVFGVVDRSERKALNIAIVWIGRHNGWSRDLPARIVGQVIGWFMGRCALWPSFLCCRCCSPCACSCCW